MKLLKIFKGKPLKRLELKVHSKDSKVRLRASRTGRLQGSYHPAPGLTFSTRYGARFSKTFKGLTLGFEGTRSILRGRWSSQNGLFNLNLSKSGFSFSSSGKRGSYNWFKPNYSSFKFAGIQLRGKKASGLAFLFVGIPALIKGIFLLFFLLAKVILFLLKILLYLVSLLMHLTLATLWILLNIVCVVGEFIDELIWYIFSYTDKEGNKSYLTVGNCISFTSKALKYFLT